MNNDYLIQKRPLHALILFALPIIAGNLFQQLYTMADSAIVGRYVGEQALAAVGACYALTNVFICVAIGGGIGASVIISRYFGAKQYADMKTAVTTALLAFLGLSVLLGLGGLLLGRQIMVLLRTPADALEMAAEYLRIYFLGLPFLFMYNVLSSTFNALGKSVIPLAFLIFSSVFNVVLDIYMVTQLHLGVAGVAWATLIAQGISAVLSFAVLAVKLRHLCPQRTRLFHRGELGRMTRIALPSILQQSTVSIGMMLVQSVVNSFGSVLAGFSAAMRVEQLCIVPMTGVGNALSSFTAQNIGAQRIDRVRRGYRAAVGMIVFFAAVSCVLLELFHMPIVSMFLDSDATPVALATGAGFLKFIGWFYILFGLKVVVDGLLRGAGDMKMFTIANMVNLFIRVVAAAALAPVFGVAMVWIAVPFGWLANFLISFAQYRTGKWKTVYTVRTEQTE